MYHSFLRKLSAIQGLLFIQLCCLFSSSNAAENNYANEGYFFSSIPTVVSASRLPQSSAELPASVTVITHQMIEASGAIEIPDLLRLVPGFQVAYVYGNTITATYHGAADFLSRRMQVLVDGRSVYLPFLSNIDWSNLGISLQDIDHIEVVRGPDAPAYGSNSFLGAINIVTRQPFQDHGLFEQGTRGSLQTKNGFIRFADTTGAVDYRISLSHRQDGGFVNINDSKQINEFSTRLIVNPRPSDNMDFQFGASDSALGPDGHANNTDNPIRDKQIQTYFGSMRWTRHLDLGNEVAIQLSHNHYSSDDRFKVGLLSQLVGITPVQVPYLFNGEPDQVIYFGWYDADVQRTEFEAQYILQSKPNWRVASGVGVQHDVLDSVQMVSGKVSQTSERAFADAEWRPSHSHFIVNAGAMLEHYPTIGSKISPRVSINYLLSSNQIFRLAAASASRAPSLLENYWDQKSQFADGAALQYVLHSNRELGAEHIDSYEAGYRVSTSDMQKMLDIKVFEEDLSNLIGYPSDSAYPQPYIPAPVYVLMNDGHMTTRGLDLEAKWNISRNTFLTLAYGYATSNGEVIRHLNPTDYTDVSKTVPKHTIGALASTVFSNRLQASLAYYQMSRTNWFVADTVPSYHRWDLRLALPLVYQRMHFKLEFVSQNVLGTSYAEYRPTNVFDRRNYLQLNLRL